MGFRLEIKIGGRTLYSHSYETMKEAKAAVHWTHGATGKVIRS